MNLIALMDCMNEQLSEQECEEDLLKLRDSAMLEISMP